MLLWLPENTDQILAELREARRAVVATGILGGGPALDVLVALAAGVPVLVVTGCGGGLTRRDAVERLRNAGAEVRVVDDRTGGLFHAKVYAVEKNDRAVTFVGSANLSSGGFAENREAMQRAEGPIAEIDALEARLRVVGPLLLDLDDLPTAPRVVGHFPPKLKKPIPLSAVLTLDWDDYVNAVLGMDGWWKAQGHDIFGEGVGWIRTLTALQDNTRAPLASLPLDARQILVGKRPGDDVAYFGDFNATPKRQVILKPTEPEHVASAAIIDAARAAVGQVGDPISLKQAGAAFDSLIGLSGVWLGVASRLLLSVRPDVFVSVNEGSREQLRAETGLILPVQAPGSRKCPAYSDLLGRVMAAPWWDVPCPSDPDGATIWRARAALLDVFVYKTLGDS